MEHLRLRYLAQTRRVRQSHPRRPNRDLRGHRPRGLPRGRGRLGRTNDLRAAESFSAEALRIADQLYENGEITIDDVLTRQSSLLSAQEALVSHRATLFTNAITLYRALGGGWTDEPPPDSATTDENGAPITEEAPAAEQADLAAAEPTPAPTPDAPDAP